MKPKGPDSNHRTTGPLGGGKGSHILYHGPLAAGGGEDADACMAKISLGSCREERLHEIRPMKGSTIVPAGLLLQFYAGLWRIVVIAVTVQISPGSSFNIFFNFSYLES